PQSSTARRNPGVGERADTNPQDDRPTVLREPVWRTAALYVVAPPAGAGLGWVLVAVADWLVTLTHAPMKGPARLITAVPTAAVVAAGVVAGLAVGLIGQ